MKTATDSTVMTSPEYRRFIEDLKVRVISARISAARSVNSELILLNQIKAGTYERAVTEKKTHNFPLALPEHLAEQADEMLKSSYNLGFGRFWRQLPQRGCISQPRVAAWRYPGFP